MRTGMVFMAILISAIITFSLRALPFLVFRGEKKMPDKLVYLGKRLPAAIMAVLIIYCLKDVADDWVGMGLPRLVSVGIVAVSYVWKHNTLFSILAGTGCYIVLLHIC